MPLATVPLGTEMVSAAPLVPAKFLLKEEGDLLERRMRAPRMEGVGNGIVG